MLHLQHNIVSILYTIKGLAESHLAQVEEGRFQQAGARLKHAEAVLQKACTQSNQALKITKRLGTVLKKDSSVILQKGKVSVQKAWRNVLKALMQEYGFNGIEILERIPEKFPPIFCNRQEFQQILYHLVENAVQALVGESGKIIFRVQLAFSSKEEPYALISLSDTGTGIEPDKFPNLFKPFFTTKPEGEGNGLGLYLVHQLVQKNHGRITVASFEGFGTTFTMEFPSYKTPSY